MQESWKAQDNWRSHSSGAVFGSPRGSPKPAMKGVFAMSVNPTKIPHQFRAYLFCLLIISLLPNLGAPNTVIANSALSDDLFSVSFCNEKEGWACGRWGTVLHSEDAGQTWKMQESGTDYTLSGVFFATPREGWAVGDGGTIIHTTDGGKSWKHQESPVPFFLMGLYFTDVRQGWIVGERTTILHTRDGGQTWEVQFQDEDFILKRVSFCDDRNGWAVGEYGFTYHTTDGGETWERQAGEFGFSEETGEIIGGNFLFDVDAVDPQTAWVVGIDGYVAQTIDAGHTWNRIEGRLPRTHLFAIEVKADGVLAIAGADALYTSPDACGHIERAAHHPQLKYGWLYDLTSVGADGFVAVGKEGWIYRTDSVASAWQPRH